MWCVVDQASNPTAAISFRFKNFHFCLLKGFVMNLKVIGACALGLSLAMGALAQSRDSKPADGDLQSRMDKFYSDGCFESNCGNVKSVPSAVPQVESRRTTLGGSMDFYTYQPSYAPGVSCTSLLGAVLDNSWIEILNTGAPRAHNGAKVDLTFNAEGRIQRKSGETDTGVGAVAVRVFLDETIGVNPPVTTELFSRWVIHSVVDSSLIDDVANPGGVNQPIINSAAVRRLLNLTTGSTYAIRVEAKWSDVFTGLTLEPGTIPFATGQRGAMVCVPVLSIAENSL